MRKSVLSSQLLSAAGSIELIDVVSFSIQNTGTADVYVGINEDANTKITLTAGAGQSFSAGAGRIYTDQQLNIDFGSSGIKSCLIFLERDVGEIDEC